MSKWVIKFGICCSFFLFWLLFLLYNLDYHHIQYNFLKPLFFACADFFFLSIPTQSKRFICGRSFFFYSGLNGEKIPENVRTFFSKDLLLFFRKKKFSSFFFQYSFCNLCIIMQMWPPTGTTGYRRQMLITTGSAHLPYQNLPQWQLLNTHKLPMYSLKLWNLNCVFFFSKDLLLKSFGFFSILQRAFLFFYYFLSSYSKGCLNLSNKRGGLNPKKVT